MSEQVPECVMNEQVEHDAQLYDDALREQDIRDRYAEEIASAESPKRRRVPLALASIFIAIAFCLIVIALVSGHNDLFGYSGAVAGVSLCFFYLGTPYGSPGYWFDKKYLKELDASEAAECRESVLNCERFKLAWIVHKRMSAYNKAFEQLARMESDEWNAWVAERLYLWQQEVEEDIGSYEFYCSAGPEVMGADLDKSIGRLKQLLLLTPAEFLCVERFTQTRI
jgi:hypothetical protein